MTEGNLAKYDAPRWNGFWRNLKEGNDLFDRTGRPPRVSVCGTRYGFAAGEPHRGLQPRPDRGVPGDGAGHRRPSNINKKVAEQPVPQTADVRDQDGVAQGGVPSRRPASYLGGPAAAAMIVNKLGENFEQQVAPETTASRRQRDADAPAALLARSAELPPLRLAARAAGAQGIAEARGARAREGAVAEEEEDRQEEEKQQAPL